MHFIKKTFVIFALSLFGIVSLQSSASAQVLELKKELSFGDKGLEVSLLQEFLKDQGFFKEEVTGYFGPLTQEAVIRYQIENDFETVDGVFALEVKSAEVTNLSNSLNIESDDPTDSLKFKIKKVKGLKSAYKPDEVIKFTVAGIKSDKKTLPHPEDGYHVQAHLSDAQNKGIDGVNAEYNYDTNVWEVEMMAPSMPGKYSISASLYCSNSTKVCFEYFGDSSESQYDWEKKIRIRGKAVATTTVPVATSTNATYKLKIENLKQSNAAHNITWTGTVASDPVLQIKCDSKQVLYSTEDRKDVECPKFKWNTIAQYENQTNNVFTLASKTGEYAKVSVRIGVEGKPKSFDEKVFVMQPARSGVLNPSTNSDSNDDPVDVEQDEIPATTDTQNNTGSTTSNNTNSTSISDSTHKCFARQGVRTPWIPVKCDSKGYINSAKINQMTILRKTNE